MEAMLIASSRLRTTSTTVYLAERAHRANAQQHSLTWHRPMLLRTNLPSLPPKSLLHQILPAPKNSPPRTKLPNSDSACHLSYPWKNSLRSGWAAGPVPLTPLAKSLFALAGSRAQLRTGGLLRDVDQRRRMGNLPLMRIRYWTM